MIIGIDASRSRSGGAFAHMVGIISELDPKHYGIMEVHVWSHKNMLNELPDKPWLIKHNPSYLEKNIFMQIFWQRYFFKKELNQYKCAIVFNTTASSVAKFFPSVTLSQDMLPFEPGEIERYKYGLGRLRLFLLNILYVRVLMRSSAVIFLTEYASRMIQIKTGPIKNSIVIPHGVNDSFRKISIQREFPEDSKSEIRCVYISSAAPYKHQWHVVRAMKILRDSGIPATLKLVGGGGGYSQKLLNNEVKSSDPTSSFVTQLSFVHIDNIPTILSESDLFIFASSCENMPVTLIEGMASGLPIACSNRGPMPEILRDGGVYFDPENPDSIAHALKKLIQNKELREKGVAISKEISNKYLWEKSSENTFKFLIDTIKDNT
jgi:glycosyltransferase involved in cell wall biosynthesis